MAIDHWSTPVGDGLLLANSLSVSRRLSRSPPALSSSYPHPPRVTPNLPNVGAVGSLTSSCSSSYLPSTISIPLPPPSPRISSVLLPSPALVHSPGANVSIARGPFESSPRGGLERLVRARGLGRGSRGEETKSNDAMARGERRREEGRERELVMDVMDPSFVVHLGK